MSKDNNENIEVLAFPNTNATFQSNENTPRENFEAAVADFLGDVNAGTAVQTGHHTPRENFEAAVADLLGDINAQNIGANNAVDSGNNDNKSDTENSYRDFTTDLDSLNTITANKYDNNEQIKKIEKELQKLRDEQSKGKFTNLSDENLMKAKRKAKQLDGTHKFSVNGEDVKGNFNFKKIELSDGDYISEQEVIAAIEKEFKNLGPNEVVVAKKTGEKVSVEGLGKEIVEAVNKDSVLELSGLKPKVKTYDIKAKSADNSELEFVSPGKGTKRFKTPKDSVGNGVDDLPEDRYVRKNIVNDILNDFEVLKFDKKRLDKRLNRMLAMYYGDSKYEQTYKQYLQEYREHIETDDDGIMRVVFDKKDQKRKEELEEFLQLEDFGYKLESLSMLSLTEEKYKTKAQNRYKALVEAYEEMGYQFPKKDNGEDLSLDEKIDLLVEKDKDYVETYNHSYNQHLSTYTHLKTLGKHGEKVPYVKLKAVRDNDGKVQFKAIVGNVGKCLMNSFIGLRNVRAHVDKFIGSKIAAPIHNKIYHSGKENGEFIDLKSKIAGLYKNLPTHRYAARRDYFEQEFLLNEIRKNEQRREEGKPEKTFGLATLIAMTNYARFKALVDYKNGNKMVLAAGAKDLADTEYERAYLGRISQKFIHDKENELLELEKQEGKIKEKLKAVTTDGDKDSLDKELEATRQKMDIVRIQLKVPSFIGLKNTQVDAISMVQHERQNKSNVTHVVTGVKTAVRIAVGLGIKNLWKRKVTEETTKWIPDKTVTKTRKEVTSEGFQNMTFDDLRGTQKSHYGTYSAVGGRKVSTESADYIRGASYEGYSGGDGLYSNSKIMTTVDTKTINGKDKVFDYLANVRSAATGKKVSAKDLADELLARNGGDSKAAIQELADKTALWVSNNKDGVPTGWEHDFDTNAIEKVATTIKKIRETIPGHIEPATREVEKLSPLATPANMALGVVDITNAYDELRRTNYGQPDKITPDVLNDEHKVDTKVPYFDRNPENEFTDKFEGTKKDDYLNNQSQQNKENDQSQQQDLSKASTPEQENKVQVQQQGSVVEPQQNSRKLYSDFLKIYNPPVDENNQDQDEEKRKNNQTQQDDTNNQSQQQDLSKASTPEQENKVQVQQQDSRKLWSDFLENYNPPVDENSEEKGRKR